MSLSGQPCRAFLPASGRGNFTDRRAVRLTLARTAADHAPGWHRSPPKLAGIYSWDQRQSNRSFERRREQQERRHSSAESTVTLSHDEIVQAIEAARADWLQAGDVEALRGALLQVLRQLEQREKQRSPGA